MTTKATTEAKRQLSFLTGFNKKFQGFRREMERLRRASTTGKNFGGHWPTEGLERIAKSLIGAGAVYDLPEMTQWAKLFMMHLETIRQATHPPTKDDLSKLGEQVGELEKLHLDALKHTGNLKPDKTVDYQQSNSPSLPPISDLSQHSRGYKKKKSVSPLAAKTKKAITLSTFDAVLTKDNSSKQSFRASVFVANSDITQKKKIIFVLKNAGFEAIDIDSPSKIIDRAAIESPDLIIIDLDEPSPWGNNLEDNLQKDPLTDFIPLLKIAAPQNRPQGNVIPKPINTERLIADVRRLAGPEAHSARITIGLSDPNLDELINFVLDEIRTGVLDSATGKNARDNFRLTNEGQLMASVWSLIAQMRKTAAVGSYGKIRFIPATSGQMGMMALAEAEEILDTTSFIDPDEAGLLALKGMRAVVVDDDPEILAVFDKILTDAGVIVQTAVDGINALEVIKENPPDIIFADIVMPRLSGWEMCNRLRTDYYLRHIPVILLSWKEDFLERLRGLKIDANEFMLKEVDKRQILGRTIRAMKPRVVLQRRLGIVGDVTGRIERVGVLTIINSVTALRPDCRITFKESWNYFEVDIRNGNLIAVTRTCTDGSFSSGPSALELLLGVNSGRFAIIDATDTPKQQFKEGTDSAIQTACQHLNIMIAQVIDGAIFLIEKIDIDENILDLYSQILPLKLRDPLNKIRSGVSIKEIIQARETSPDAIETLIVDLIRTGAIRSITAPEPDPERALIPKDSKQWSDLISGKPAPDRESTIPLKSLELEEIGSLQSIPPAESSTPLLPPINRDKKGTFAWRTTAIIAIIALSISGYLNLKSLGDTSVSPPKIAAPKPTPIAKTPPMPAPKSIPSLVAQPEPPQSETPKTVTPQKETKQDNARKRKKRKRSKEKNKNIETTKGKSIDTEIDKEKQPSETVEPTGTLSVNLPSENIGNTKVSVDGKPHGNAPIRIKLSPGLHEIVLTINGKRELRMVNIKQDKVKSIVPKAVQ